MQSFLSELFRPLLGLLLIVLALLLMVVVSPLAALWKTIICLTHADRKPRDLLRSLGAYFLEIAISFDQLGNTLFGGFFQWLFIRRGATQFYPFSDEDETLSEVLGWNQRMGTLSRVGLLCVELLDLIDPDHAQNALRDAVRKARLKLEHYRERIAHPSDR